MLLTASVVPPAPFGLAATFCALAAVFCVVILLRAARTGTGCPRAACVVIAAAVTAGSVTLGTVAVLRPMVAVESLVAVVAAGVGFAAATVLFGAGLLMLPSVVAVDARGARVLDGLLFTTAGIYIWWGVYLEPWHERMDYDNVTTGLDGRHMTLAAPLVLTAVVFGIAAVSAAHLYRHRSPALIVCAGVSLFAVGAGSLMMAAADVAVVALAGIGGVAVVAGYLAVAVGTCRSRRVPAPGEPTETYESALSVIAVAVALGAGAARMAAGRPMDSVSIYISIGICGILAAQQRLARRDIGRYAERLAEREAHFRTMAHTDALTGLANRRELIRTLQNKAVGGPSCVLLAIDLDGFKNINDIRGHDVGDVVLVEVATRLRSNVRPDDCAARLGGDEFAVLMWARPDEAHAAAERILAGLSRPYELPAGSVFLSASVGMAGCATANSIDSLLRNADLALRFAKLRGKNRIEAYDLAYDELVRRNTELEQELRGAVERGELMLVYQPIVELAEDRVAGVEALLRWHHPRLGTVSPGEFIPLAEEADLIHGIGAFVVDEACRQLARWVAEGHELWLSVNASMRELHTPEYADRLAEVLEKHGVSAGRLVIEVTEHAVASDVDQLVERLRTLREIGVRVALDDFGSGYSSLNLLRALPVDILKIDRALLDADGESPLVDVVVGLGHRLGLDVVAEGVANAEHRAMLERCGCRYGQGTMLGGPLPVEHVEVLFPTPCPIVRAQRGPVACADAVPSVVPTGVPTVAPTGVRTASALSHLPAQSIQSVGSVDSARDMRQS